MNVPTPMVGQGGSWSFARLTQAKHWWKAPIAGAADNDPVSSFADLIGSANMSGSGSTRPLYKTGSGSPYLHFDGVDDKLTFTNTMSGDFSMFAIFQYFAKKAYGILLSNTAANMQVSYDNTNNALFFQRAGGFGTLTRPIPAAPTGFLAVYIEHVGNNGKMRVNSSETTGTIASAPFGNSMLIGEYSGAPGTYQGDIDLKEMGFANAAITGADWTAFAADINTRYALTI